MHKKQVILITGGTSGLGKVIAQLLASKGHMVYCTSRHPVSENVDNINIKTDESYVDPLIRFFRMRERRLARR